MLNSLRNNKKIGDKFVFEGSEMANSFKVSIDKEKNSLLTQVGFVNIETDIEFENQEEDEDVLSFGQVLNVLRRRRQLKNWKKELRWSYSLNEALDYRNRIISAKTAEIALDDIKIESDIKWIFHFAFLIKRNQ